MFWPLLLWWGIGYVIFNRSRDLLPRKWFTAAAVSIFLSMFLIVAWYYIWTEAFASENEFINIGSIFFAVPIAQLIGMHVYKAVEPRTFYLILSILFFILFAGMFMWFTFNPPDFPLFIPPSG